MLEKVSLTLAALVAIPLVTAALRTLLAAAFHGDSTNRARFWLAQAVKVASLAAIIVAVAAIWTSALAQRTAVVGWLAAGLTIALQRVVTALAGYVIILRSRIFSVGDRITIGSVRGDVVALGFMQTTVMEMGQAPGERGDDPAMWIGGRQYSGRLVRVTNDKVFDSPVYNYTRDFPFVWEELTVPVRYQDDYRVVEGVMLDVITAHTRRIVDDARPFMQGMRKKYFLNEEPAIEPRAYIRMTDNWLELSVRYLSRDRGARDLHDAITREVLAGMQRANIGVASGTYAIVELPTVQAQLVARKGSEPPPVS